MSAEETTPLTAGTSSAQIGPAYVFPGGVSPRSRRNQKMQRLQCCIGITIILIVLAGLITAFVLVNSDPLPLPTLLLPAVNDSTNQNVNDEAVAAIRHTVAPVPDEPSSEWALEGKNVNHTVRQQAVSAGIKALGDREILEENLQSTPVHSAAFRHYRSLSTNPEARKLTRRGYVENHATSHIAQIFNYSKPVGRNNIGKGPYIELPDPTLNGNCDFNERYRRPNGACNSKANPHLYGVAMTPYRRMVAPDYADGISQPRVSHDVNGTQLPPAREVSLRIHRASYDTDANFTVMLAVFGQFLDHDITATSLSSLQEGESIDCCTLVPPTLDMHPECFPVPILLDDPYYQQYNVTCLNFVRSAPAPTRHFGPREQLNQATAFIDGSAVYGNTQQRQRQLRTMLNGTLRMYITSDGRELLPLSTNPDDGCNLPEMLRDGKYCFDSGDDRANENLLLTSMHLLWARHHNYLARGLQRHNPQWDDETVFQETRKILGAEMAHITYNEFLPILLGRELAEKKGLLPAMTDLQANDTYDPQVDPRIANCFASAAFRFAHTLLPDLLNATRDYSRPESIELHKMLFNPFSLWSKGGIDKALQTATNTPVMRVNRFFSLEVTQKMFQGSFEDHPPICGLDLVSLNIQRGRDHGLPAYPVFRRHCRLPPVDTWQQMATVIEPSSLQSIRDIYNTPQDVDVYTGALSEPPLQGAIFGPLLTCLVSDQFMRLKRGDSNWYERKMGVARFKKAQLSEIYKTTLSKIICRNSDDVQQVRKHVMERRQEPSNPLTNCSDFEHFDFSAWAAPNHSIKLHSVAVSQRATLEVCISYQDSMATLLLSDQFPLTEGTPEETKLNSTTVQPQSSIKRGQNPLLRNQSK